MIEVRWGAGEALGDINDPRVTTLLLNAFNGHNIPVIAAAHRFFMRRLDPASPDVASVDVLIEALQVGDAGMANNFLNSGNARLQQAGEEWGRGHGFMIGGTGDGRKTLSYREWVRRGRAMEFPPKRCPYELESA